MTTISAFYGIVIRMFYQDHTPPHFHALYNEYETLIDIDALTVIKGKISQRELKLVLEWAHEYRSQLLEDWELCEQKQELNKIPPLQE